MIKILTHGHLSSSNAGNGPSMKIFGRNLKSFRQQWNLFGQWEFEVIGQLEENSDLTSSRPPPGRRPPSPKEHSAPTKTACNACQNYYHGCIQYIFIMAAFSIFYVKQHDVELFYTGCSFLLVPPKSVESGKISAKKVKIRAKNLHLVVYSLTRVTSVESLEDILTHQSHISQVSSRYPH